MSIHERMIRSAVAAAAVVALLMIWGVRAAGQAPAIVVLIDQDSITHGTSAGAFTTQDLNDELASVGMRDGLPVFKRNAGKSLQLATNRGGNAGWHTLVGVPPSWNSGPDENDGLSNFVLAGPGLGSGDEGGNRTKFLRDAGIAAMGADSIRALQGAAVCGVVFQGDLAIASSNADLSGATLGLVAFKVTSTDGVTVDLEPLDAQEVCSGELRLPDKQSP